MEERGRWARLGSWTWAWILWIGAFFVIELPALLNKAEGDTLSEHLRKWFHTQNDEGHPMVVVHLLRLVPLGFAIWLTGHLYWGW